MNSPDVLSYHACCLTCKKYKHALHQCAARLNPKSRNDGIRPPEHICDNYQVSSDARILYADPQSQPMLNNSWTDWRRKKIQNLYESCLKEWKEGLNGQD